MTHDPQPTPAPAIAGQSARWIVPLGNGLRLWPVVVMCTLPLLVLWFLSGPGSPIQTGDLVLVGGGCLAALVFVVLLNQHRDGNHADPRQPQGAPVLDAITGLPDRRALIHHVGVCAASPYGGPYTLVLMELPAVPPTDRTPSGLQDDMTARKAASALTGATRADQDAVFRVDAEVYAVVLRGAARGDAHRVAWRLLDRVEEVLQTGPTAHAGRPAVGLAQLRADEAGSDWINRTYAAVTRARTSGCRVYDAAPPVLRLAHSA